MNKLIFFFKLHTLFTKEIHVMYFGCFKKLIYNISIRISRLMSWFKQKKVSDLQLVKIRNEKINMI